MATQVVVRSMPGFPAGDMLLEFSLPLPRNLCCTLCRAVAPTIYRGICCHAFCERCKSDLLHERNVLLCPVDGTETWHDKLVPDDTIWQSLRDFDVKCIHSGLGCGFQDTLAQLKHHLLDCPYMKKTCPLCGDEVLSKDLFGHLGTTCPKRPLSCEHCGLNFHRELLPEHKENCPDRLVQCDFCGKRDIVQRQMANHYEECEEKPWYCTMREYGCAFEGKGKELLDHLTFEDHVHLIVSHFKELAVVNKQQQDEISHLNFQMDALTKAVREGNRRVSHTLNTITRTLQCQQEENGKLKGKMEELQRMIESRSIAIKQQQPTTGTKGQQAQQKISEVISRLGGRKSATGQKSHKRESSGGGIAPAEVSYPRFIDVTVAPQSTTPGGGHSHHHYIPLPNGHQHHQHSHEQQTTMGGVTTYATPVAVLTGLPSAASGTTAAALHHSHTPSHTAAAQQQQQQQHLHMQQQHLHHHHSHSHHHHHHMPNV